MKIHWLASFPKSGNTWVRFLLYRYFYGEITNSADVGKRIPDIHAGDLARASTATRTQLIKTHWGLSPQMPHVDRTAGAIYIVRHPRDVLLSMLNYYRLREPLAKWTDEHFVRLFIQSGADPGSLRNGFGTWEDNLLSWLSQRQFPLLLVRYEDLKEDAAKELRRMVAFLGEELDEDRIMSSVASCSFERMRSLEAREKASNLDGNVFIGGKAELDRGLMHMSKARSGQTLASIGVNLDREFDQRFGSAAWLVGYRTASSRMAG